jgi:hypothetical protein
MKKVLLVSAFAVLALASCKKDYTCSCKTLGTETSTTTINDTKAKAEDKCAALGGTVLGVETTCSIVE